MVGHAGEKKRALTASVASLALFIAVVGPTVPSAARPSPPRRPAIAHLMQDDLTAAFESGSLSAAEYALQRALSVFHPGKVRERFGDVERLDPELVTFAMRDLSVRREGLGSSQRRLADRILARPTDGAADPQAQGYDVPSRVSCGAHVCIHWVESTEDAVPLADGNGNATPDHVELVQSILEQVWAIEVDAMGYRAPKSDLFATNHGPDEKLDFYLAEISDAAEGFCTPDDQNNAAVNPDSGYPYWDFAVYCVIDNDYAHVPGHEEDALRATVAHEFFHAVQCAYDCLEDIWMAEGTAAWIEDEVFDDVNDNLQYLNASPLSHPRVPVDTGRELHAYGAWLFFRHLSENTADPALIREIWELADASESGTDKHSIESIKIALAARGKKFPPTFAAFGRNNLLTTLYEEGASYVATAGPVPRSTRTISGSKPRAAYRTKLDHLTNAHYVLKPGAGAGTGAKLRLNVDLPAATRGGRASVLILKRGGGADARDLAGAMRVPFARTKIAAVIVVLTNSSTRFDCSWETEFSCGGFPLDDDMSYLLTARLIR